MWRLPVVVGKSGLIISPIQVIDTTTSCTPWLTYPLYKCVCVRVSPALLAHKQASERAARKICHAQLLDDKNGRKKAPQKRGKTKANKRQLVITTGSHIVRLWVILLSTNCHQVTCCLHELPAISGLVLCKSALAHVDRVVLHNLKLY